MILWDRATGLGIKVMCSDVKLQVVMACVADPLDRKYNHLGYGLLGMYIGDHCDCINGSRSILLGSGPFPSLELWNVQWREGWTPAIVPLLFVSVDMVEPAALGSLCPDVSAMVNYTLNCEPSVPFLSWVVIVKGLYHSNKTLDNTQRLEETAMIYTIHSYVW